MPPTTYAGLWGPEVFEDSARTLLRNTAVTIYQPGTNTKITTYLSRTKTGPGLNPVFTDAYGNGQFFADPGEYEIECAGRRLLVQVNPDPAEAAGGGPTGVAGGVLGGTYPNPTFAVDMATQAELDAHATAESTSRTNAINAAIATEVTNRNNAIATETTNRQNADALLIPLTQKAAANGVATLDAGGKLTAAQVPALSISDFLGTVASQAAMLALVGQRGDWAIRTDTPVVSGVAQSSSWILITDDPTQLANWKQLPTPGDAVLSVDGLTGVIALPVDAAAGTGSKRTLGTGALQAAAGNDARFTDTRTPTDGSVTAAKINAEAWTAYTPADTNITIGNGTRVARRLIYGKTCYMRYSFVLGSTSSLGSPVSIGLPATAHASGYQVMPAYYLDSGVQHYIGMAVIAPSATSASLVHNTTTGTGGVGTGSPFGWTTGDEIVITGQFETA